MRIELTPKAWEAPVLPLNYTRNNSCISHTRVTILGLTQLSLICSHFNRFQGFDVHKTR